MYFLVNDFITSWIGEKFILGNGIVILMLVNVFISVIRIPCDIFKNATGFFGDVYYPLLEGVVNLFFPRSWLFILVFPVLLLARLYLMY